MNLKPIDRAGELAEVEREVLELRFKLRQISLIGGKISEAQAILIQIEREKVGGMPANLEQIRRRINELKR